jgi:hypothetical protein
MLPDAPLSLSNVLTVLCAIACLWTAAPQTRGGVVPLWVVALPGVFGAAVSFVLLAGVFDTTPAYDAEWVACLIVGSVIGRARGWSLPVEVILPNGVIRLPAAWDGMLFAAGVVAMAAIDFISAALGRAVVHPNHIASVAAFCAGFLGCHAMAVLMRSSREA